MPIIRFKSQEDYDRAFLLEYENMYMPLEERLKGPVSCFNGGEELYEGIFIYTVQFLELFDKRNLNYELLNEFQAKKYLTPGGKKLWESYKKNHPEFFV